MRQVRCGALAVVLLIGSAGVAHGSGDAAPKPLGTFPICETSAARVIACDGETAHTRCVIVGDNEIPDRLFVFSVNGDGELTDHRELAFKFATPDVQKIDDIEALEVGADGVLVFGSHSRKSFKPDADQHCQVDGGRLAFAQLQRHGAELRGTAVKTNKEAWRGLLTAAGCSAQLIATAPGDAASRALAQQACAAIADADAHAEQDPAACSRAFNIEGVVSVPGPGGAAPRVWVGLRSPVVDGKAVLLRLHDLSRLQFDGIALIALDGFGVRDLAYARGALWVLAGPMADEEVAGSLWSVPADDVTSGAELHGVLAPGIAALPAFAEGLAIDAPSGDAFVIVDGDAGKGSGSPPACKTAAGQVLRHLPTGSTQPAAPLPTAGGPHAARLPAGR
jgi:hypothetical protein